jgi:hypothetical protein
MVTLGVINQGPGPMIVSLPEWQGSNKNDYFSREPCFSKKSSAVWRRTVITLSLLLPIGYPFFLSSYQNSFSSRRAVVSTQFFGIFIYRE